MKPPTDRDGQTMFKALPGGTIEEKACDTRGRTTLQHTTAPGTLLWPGEPGSAALLSGLTFPGTPGPYITKHFYHYDNPGNLCLLQEETPAAGDTAVALPDREIINGYDATYRLTQERVITHDTPARTEITDYWYDHAGNRTGMERDFGPAEELGLTTYQYGDPAAATGPLAGPSNQVRTMLRPDGTSVQYRYSPYGCRSHRWVNPGAPVSTPPTATDLFTWDRENRLIAGTISSPAPCGVPRTPGAYTFRYDHRTRRVRRSNPETTALITYSAGLSVQEYDGTAAVPGGSSSDSSSSSNPTVEYIRGSDYGGGIGGILYTIRAGQASCQHYNSRGDVVAKSDATTAADVTWAAAYLAFGTRPEEKGTNPDPQRANTKEEDGTGLLNEGHRYRCLETGMFISRDPAGFVDGPNLYAYVRQNPWTSFDPDGLQTPAPANQSWWNRLHQQVQVTVDYAIMNVAMVQHAESKFKDHKDEIGTNAPGAAASTKKKIHCTTYPVETIAVGYDKIGATKTAAEIRAMSAKSGVEIASKLKALGWHNTYYNPDTLNKQPGPSGNAGEHSESNRIAKTSGTYYRVPVDERAVNFDPKLGGAVNTTSPPTTPQQQAVFDKLTQQPFGLVIGTGAFHNAVMVNGSTIEVHWSEDSDPAGGDRLYEKKTFKNWSRDHASGLVLTPPANPKEKAK